MGKPISSLDYGGWGRPSWKENNLLQKSLESFYPPPHQKFESLLTNPFQPKSQYPPVFDQGLGAWGGVTYVTPLRCW